MGPRGSHTESAATGRGANRGWRGRPGREAERRRWLPSRREDRGGRLPSLLPHVPRGAIAMTVRHRQGEAAGGWRLAREERGEEEGRWGGGGVTDAAGKKDGAADREREAERRRSGEEGRRGRRGMSGGEGEGSGRARQRRRVFAVAERQSARTSAQVTTPGHAFSTAALAISTVSNASCGRFRFSSMSLSTLGAPPPLLAVGAISMDASHP